MSCKPCGCRNLPAAAGGPESCTVCEPRAGLWWTLGAVGALAAAGVAAPHVMATIARRGSSSKPPEPEYEFGYEATARRLDQHAEEVRQRMYGADYKEKEAARVAEVDRKERERIDLRSRRIAAAWASLGEARPAAAILTAALMREGLSGADARHYAKRANWPTEEERTMQAQPVPQAPQEKRGKLYLRDLAEAAKRRGGSAARRPAHEQWDEAARTGDASMLARRAYALIDAAERIGALYREREAMVAGEPGFIWNHAAQQKLKKMENAVNHSRQAASTAMAIANAAGWDFATHKRRNGSASESFMRPGRSIRTAHHPWYWFSQWQSSDYADLASARALSKIVGFDVAARYAEPLVDRDFWDEEIEGAILHRYGVPPRLEAGMGIGRKPWGAR